MIKNLQRKNEADYFLSLLNFCVCHVNPFSLYKENLSSFQLHLFCMICLCFFSHLINILPALKVHPLADALKVSRDPTATFKLVRTIVWTEATAQSTWATSQPAAARQPTRETSASTVSVAYHFRSSLTIWGGKICVATKRESVKAKQQITHFSFKIKLVHCSKYNRASACVRPGSCISSCLASYINKTNTSEATINTQKQTYLFIAMLSIGHKTSNTVVRLWTFTHLSSF